MEWREQQNLFLDDDAFLMIAGQERHTLKSAGESKKNQIYALKMVERVLCSFFTQGFIARLFLFSTLWELRACLIHKLATLKSIRKEKNFTKKNCCKHAQKKVMPNAILCPPAFAFAALPAALDHCRREEIASTKSRRNCSAMRSSAAWSSLRSSG